MGNAEPYKPQTDPIKAMTIAALGDLGYSGRKIARVTGTPASTVYDILGGDKQYLQAPVHAQVRALIKSRLQARSLDIADRALNQIEMAIPETGARDAAVVYGILRQHERLDAGEPTSITDGAMSLKVPSLDALAGVLAEVVQLRREARAVDVTPNVSEDAQIVGKVETSGT